MERKFTVNVTSPNECKRVLTIEIPREEVEREEEKMLQNYRRELKVPGFRKGKVPLRYIEKNYGDAIHTEAVQNLLPEVYEKALAQEKIIPLGDPQFENMKAERGSNVIIDITVEVPPVVEIKGYQNLEVEVAKKEIGDKEVTEALEHLRRGFVTFKVVDRESREGDYLVIDHAPVLDSGETDEKGMIRNYPVDLSSESLFPEFREGLIGMRTGEEKRIIVHYPADFPDKDLAGKERTFYVSLREIKEGVLPELDDAFVQRIGGDISNLDELKERILQDLMEEEERRYKREVEEKIIDSLIEKNPFEVPNVMVENYLASFIEEDRKAHPNARDQEERDREIRKLFHKTAVRAVKRFFVLTAVRDQGNLSVGKEELEQKIGEIADGSGENIEEVQTYFRDPNHRTRLENQLLDEKVLNFLRENADIKAA